MTTLKVAGFQWPFFPMRPMASFKIRETTFDFVMSQIFNGEWFVQPKMDGDRAILATLEDGQVIMANRHGSEFKHPVLNRGRYAGLPPMTILDGEVWAREFIPFEMLALNGASLAKATPEFRARQAMWACKDVGVKWPFIPPTPEWIQAEMKNSSSPWEGVVCKATSSEYIPMGSETMESTAWVKMRWR
jgi:ATP-dependent DNA ligase